MTNPQSETAQVDDGDGATFMDGNEWFYADADTDDGDTAVREGLARNESDVVDTQYP